MTAHAFLAPSSAFRWGPGACPASPTMEAAYPEDEESPEARQGTAAHFYATEALQGRVWPIGTLAPNGHPIDGEMIDAASDFIRDVQDTAAAHPRAALRIETRVTMAASVHAQNWGTPDVYLVDRVARVVFIWDYKYGHRYVDAFRNWQCLDYAVGVFETDELAETWADWRVVITVAQPRNYHPDGPMREWHLTGEQLEAYREQLAVAAERAMAADAPMTTGDHCRDCRARHACPALERVAMGLVDMSMTGQPIDLPPGALGMELRVIREAMKRLGARATGLEEQALALARNGVSIPHWRAEYSMGRTRWAVPVQQVIELGKNFGIELGKPAALTPTQATKAGLDPDLIKAFSETPRGGMALVPFDDADIAKRFN